MCASSDSLQSEFFKNVFTAWDTHQNHIKYLTIFKTTDWSQAVVDDLAIRFGTTDPIFKEYLRTLGVRTFPRNGVNKIAYETILGELNARDCYSVNCTTTGLDEQAQMSALRIYPNPSHGAVTIETEKSIKQVSIYNTVGKLCFVSGDSNINISGLRNGLYRLFIQFETGEVERKKLMKK